MIFALYSILAIYLFVKEKSETIHIKNQYIDEIGIFFLFYFSLILLQIFLLKLNVNIILIINVIFELIISALAFIVGIFYLCKTQIVSLLFSCGSTPKNRNYLLISPFAFLLIMFFIVIILDIVYSRTFFKEISFNFGILISLLKLAMDTIIEETIFRLFLLSLLIYYFRNIKYGIFLAILLSTLLWIFDHDFLLISQGYRLIQLVLFSILLSYQYIKYGFESVVITHSSYNIIAYLFLSGLK